MTTKSLSFTTLSTAAVTITVSLSLMQTLASAQSADPDGTSIYTEASYLMDAPEPTPDHSSIGGPYFGVLPEGNIQTWEEIAAKLQVKPEDIMAPYLFNTVLDFSQTVPQQSFTLFQYQF
jgi:hypothetical protein